ncbi:Acetyl esterase/lipase [Nonlabens sp. Hel1_33_55]|uniref:alpha/beta hydrolase n=1 Tax=Nonlabens sp. Hel1_33_55 TaxID=1336802 RepID=UPI000875DE10|nr:alpha/beta hydrolase [Nonlabens sp. Hel1_33_55]SCY41597.1 Acetyl esterase/lipase [Nonlabens sp. Hel1_33_55]
MTFSKSIITAIVLSSFLISTAQEEEPEFKPYTAASTLKKLSKDYPFINPIDPVDPSLIRSKECKVYKKVDGTKLELDIYLPKSRDQDLRPAVLLIHGGGWLVGSRENQRAMAKNLASNGFVAITVSYRLGLETPYPAAVLDIKDAVKWTRKRANRYGVDPDKIAILGASAGAQLATLVGVTPDSELYLTDTSISDQVQAIVNIDGIVSFIHPEASAEGKMASIWLDGSKEENYSAWKEASPLEHLSQDDPPILFINSAQPRFHAGRDDMIFFYKNNEIYSEQHTLPETPHSFWLVQPWFETTLNYTTTFLNEVFDKKN